MYLLIMHIFIVVYIPLRERDNSSLKCPSLAEFDKYDYVLFNFMDIFCDQEIICLFVCLRYKGITAILKCIDNICLLCFQMRFLCCTFCQWEYFLY